MTGFCSGILDGILETFDIHSPSRRTAYVGQMLDTGLAEGVEENAETPQQAMRRMAADLLDEAYVIPERIESAQPSVPAVTAPALSADGELMGRLDRILSAIERGQVLMLDGKAIVGGTIDEINTQLAQIQVLTARSEF